MAEITSLFYPETKAKIGDYQFTKGISLSVYSSKDTYFDWAKVKMLKAFENQITMSKLDEAEIMLGYDQNLHSVFKGYVFKLGEEKELILKDDMLKLENTKLTHTFLDASPTDIVEYCLRQAGITQYKLFEKKYPKRKIVPVQQKNVIQILEEVKRLWKIEDLFYFAQGIFYFGQKHDQAKIYKFEYGSNIISLTKESGLWVIETASVPFIRHSDYIDIEHPQVSGRYEVSKIIFSGSDAGFLRSRIYF